ncbi:MAG: hypothetical protein OJI97_04425 [Sphingopyxis sp.]|nr:hypothetical protein [Sphingopyxis sp.]MCW0197374.1 hypothetical protein [Sphingopyxis sp.]
MRQHAADILFDLSLREAERGGDLAPAHFFEAIEDEDHAGPFRQHIHRLDEALIVLAAHRFAFGRDFVDEPPGRIGKAFKADIGANLLAPETIAQQVRGDLEHIAFDILDRIVVGALREPGEHILRQILRFGRIADAAKEESVNRILVAKRNRRDIAPPVLFPSHLHVRYSYHKTDDLAGSERAWPVSVNKPVRSRSSAPNAAISFTRAPASAKLYDALRRLFRLPGESF